MKTIKTLRGTKVLWLRSHDRDPGATKLADKHYSRKHIGAKEGFVGPGEKLVLLSPDGKALFVWLRCKPEYRLDGQAGINCTMFRNEGSELSSTLILAAEQWALHRWPQEKRLYTYVKKSAVQSSRPGWCFLKAGWRQAGQNKTGKLLLFEKVLA